MASKNNRIDIRFSGSGGQGLILSGKILAEAAGIFENKNVVQTQAYGPEARGGASRADVIIDNKPIKYPEISKPNCLIALSQAACDKYYFNLSRRGFLIVDSTNVTSVPTNKTYCIPFTQISKDVLGSPMSANIASLAALSVITEFVSEQALIDAIRAKSPARFVDKNIKVFKECAKYTKKYLEDRNSDNV